MQGWFHSGIFRRVLLAILVTSLLPLGALGVLVWRGAHRAAADAIERSQDALERAATRALELRARETAQRVADFLSDREADVRTLAALPHEGGAFLAFSSAHQGRRWYRDASGEHLVTGPLYREVALVDRVGREVVKVSDDRLVSAGELRDVSDPANTLFKSEDYFQRVRQTRPGGVYVSRVVGFYVNRSEYVAGRRFAGVVRFATPLTDPHGGFAGAVVLALDSRFLAELIAHVVPTGSGIAAEPDAASGSYAYIVGDDALPVAHPEEYLLTGVGPHGERLATATTGAEVGVVPLRLDHAGFVDENLARLHRLASAGRAGSLHYTWEGRDKVAAYAPIAYYGGSFAPPAGFGWVGIAAEVGTFHQAAARVGAAVRGEAARLTTEILATVAVTGFTIVLVAGVLAGRISRPVRRLTEAALAVERGDFVSARTVGAFAPSGTELGVLTSGFSRMAARLHDTLAAQEGELAERRRAEETARESERRYRSLFDGVPVSLYRSRPSGELLDVNVAMVQALGFPDRDALFRVPAGALYADPTVHPRWMELMGREGVVRGFEAEFRRHDGSTVWLSDTARAVRDDRGKVLFFEGTLEDVTERRRVEAALREHHEHLEELVEERAARLAESESCFKAVFDSSSDAIMLLGSSGYLDCNARSLEMFSCANREEFVGCHPADLSPPLQPDGQDSRTAAEDRMRTAVERGSLRFEWLHRRLNGEEFSAEVSLSALRLRGDTILQATVHDITERKRAREQLMASERRLAEIVDLLPDATVVIDRDGRVIFWNRAIEEMTGIPAADMLGKGNYEYAIPFYGERRPILIDLVLLPREDLLARYAHVQREGEVLTGETYVSSLRGGGVYLFARATALRDPAGDVVGAIEVIRDITDRKKAEERLQESEQRLSDIISFLPDPTLVIDRGGRVIAWNRAMEKLTGIKASDILGKGDREYAIAFYGERRPVLVDLVFTPEHELSGRYANVTREGGILAAEAYATNLPGGAAYLFATASALRDSKGNVVGAIEIARDITERKRAEDALRASEEEFRAVFDRSNDAIFIHGIDGQILDANQSACVLLGYDHDELTSMTAADVDAPEQAGRVTERIASLLAQGRAMFESAHRRRDGTTFPVEVSSSFMEYRGEKAIISICRDITERRRSEEALQRAIEAADAASAAKSAFLAMMSHEIRTPMNAIIGMSGLLLNTELDDDQHEFAETIRTSGDALLTIINDILDFSKIEAGKMELEQQPFDLRECLESSLDLLKIRAREKGLELACDIAPEVPVAVVGDVTRLRQILLNLLNNAIKFTERGEVVLTASVAGSPDDARVGGPPGVPGSTTGLCSLHFTVRDTGVGIPPDRLDRLFRAFSQVDASISRRHGGTGLGLAISRRLAEMMGGRIWVSSEVGKGSEFHLTIPAEVAPELTRRPHLAADQPMLRGKRMLIVDDNPTNRRILVLQARAWGMQARDTGSPNEALEWVRRGDPFDLAILDIQMPEMDGGALAGEIRTLRSASELPLVMLSSIGGREEGGCGPSFSACLTKPIKQSALFDALVNVLAGTPATAASRPATGPRIGGEMAARLPLRILVAEDNLVNQKLAVRLLAQMGYAADVVANGNQVLAALDRSAYDVILMDVQMPEMDGLEAARRICASRSRAGRPHIIAVTANAMQGDREACLAAGMDDYLAKPIRLEELVAALERRRPA